MNEWTRLSSLLDDDPALPGSVRAAKRDRWGAIIDGLDDAGALAYLEWEDGGVELSEALAELPQVRRAGVDLDPVGDIEDLTEAIIRADELLAPHGLRLLYLEEDAEACPLVVIDRTNAEEILALAQSLGREARVFDAE